MDKEVMPEQQEMGRGNNIRITNRVFISVGHIPYNIDSFREVCLIIDSQKVQVSPSRGYTLEEMLHEVLKRKGVFECFNDQDRRAISLDNNHEVDILPEDINTLEKIFDNIVKFISKYMKEYLGIDDEFIPEFPSDYSNVYVIPEENWKFRSVGVLKQEYLNIYVRFPGLSDQLSEDKKRLFIYNFLHTVMHEFLEYMSYKQFLLVINKDDSNSLLSIRLLQRRQDMGSYSVKFAKDETGGMAQGLLDTKGVFIGFHEGLIEVMIKDILQYFKQDLIQKFKFNEQEIDNIQGSYGIFQNMVYAIIDKVKEYYKDQGVENDEEMVEEFKKELFRGFFTGNMSVLKLVEKIYGRHTLRILASANPYGNDIVNNVILDYLRGKYNFEEVFKFLPYDVKYRILLEKERHRFRLLRYIIYVLKRYLANLLNSNN